jgi:hypothetical protein
MNPDAPLPAPDHEMTDASPRAIALLAFSLVAIVGVCLLTAAWIYHHREKGGSVASTLAPNGRFQNGADETTGIAQAWQEQDQRVHEHLYGYGWVDRPAGIVHIPIDRAMDLILTETRPAVPPADPTKAAP